MKPDATIVDAGGRTWHVYDFTVLAGKTKREPFGRGQYRGFDPADGGARRTFLLLESDRQRGTSIEVLLEQLAASQVYYMDDPVKSAQAGAKPERFDLNPET